MFFQLLKFTKIIDTYQSLESTFLLVEKVALGAMLVDPAGFNLPLRKGYDRYNMCLASRDFFGFP